MIWFELNVVSKAPSLRNFTKNGQTRWAGGGQFVRCMPDEVKSMKRQPPAAGAELQRTGTQSGMVPKGGRDGKVPVAGSSAMTPEADTPGAHSSKSGMTGAESVDEVGEDVGQEVGSAAHTLP